MELTAHHTDWLLIVTTLSFVLLIAVRLYNIVRFKQLSFLPFHASRADIEDSFNPVPGKGFVDFSLSIMSPVIIALTCYLLIHPYNGAVPIFSDWALYLRLLFIVTIFFLLKNFLGMFVGWVFGTAEEIGVSQNVYLAYRSWMAIVLLPFCVLLIFFPSGYAIFYYILLIITVLGLLLALLFTVLRIWNMRIVAYYKIFYICALEITPLIFLIGWLLSLVR